MPHTPLLSPVCVSCLVKKQMDRYPASASREQVLAYLRRLGEMMASLPDRFCGPEIMEAITDIRRAVFGSLAAEVEVDYTAVKQHFNAWMLDFSAACRLSERIFSAADPLRTALGYAMIGNYIDFGAMNAVDESKLRALLDQADAQVPADSDAYRALVSDLAHARNLVFLTDNCGEIVMDQLLIDYLRTAYPELAVTVIVRGFPVLNDATVDDAVQVGLDHIPGITLMDNGDTLAGTSLARISPASRAAVESADLIIAKGQGNFETLQGSSLNIYYAFLCKCTLFSTRFGVPLYTGMLVREQDVGKYAE